MSVRHGLAGLMAALGAGCGPLASSTGALEPAPAAPDPAETRLVEAALRAEAALTALARVRTGQAPQPAPPLPDRVPPELLRAVTLDWIGPLETLAGALAERAGYRFVTAGPAPVRPVIVRIGADGRALIDVLRDAGLQAGGAGALTVDAARRTVRLDWTPPGEGA